MTDDDAGNVERLRVRFKEQHPERTLLHVHEAPPPNRCDHTFVQYVVSESEAEVTCGKCGAKLNPMWVLARLASQDRRFMDARARYKEEMQRLSERSRTKCEHCGQMTGISRR